MSKKLEERLDRIEEAIIDIIAYHYSEEDEHEEDDKEIYRKRARKTFHEGRK